MNLIDVKKQKEWSRTSNEVETAHCLQWNAWRNSTR